jgi:hypothetical protein
MWLPDSEDITPRGKSVAWSKQLYNPVMARIWKEPYDSAKHLATPIEYWGNADDHLRAPGLIPKDVVLVHVASFTFQFLSVQQLRDCLSFFEQKVHPSSRLPMPPNTSAGMHGEAQRWFERLRMHLQEEPKRQKVVEALRRALRLIDEDKL